MTPKTPDMTVLLILLGTAGIAAVAFTAARFAAGQGQAAVRREAERGVA